MRRWLISRITVFNTPFVVGFDHVERMVEHIAKAGDNSYPPFDIEHLEAGHLRISLAVAGFAKENLTVTVEGTVLTVLGQQPEDGKRSYLHRGIAGRKFRKKFILDRGIEITGARLRAGLLEIDLLQPPSEKTLREIVIDDH
jgi:HSP20 family molecular chaperone IbpA